MDASKMVVAIGCSQAAFAMPVAVIDGPMAVAILVSGVALVGIGLLLTGWVR